MAHSFAFGAVITGRRLRQLVVSTSTSLRKEPVLQQLCRCATFSANLPGEGAAPWLHGLVIIIIIKEVGW